MSDDLVVAAAAAINAAASTKKRQRTQTSFMLGARLDVSYRPQYRTHAALLQD